MTHHLDDAITDSPDAVTIGALATLENHPLIVASFPALAQAVALAQVTPLARNAYKVPLLRACPPGTDGDRDIAVLRCVPPAP